MPSQDPTFWLLDHRTGWRTARNESGHALAMEVSIGVVLRLAANPQGPLALHWRDGSLGGLLLPRGMALDNEGTLYLLGLAPRAPWIKRFDPRHRCFVPLPLVGEYGREARQFRRPQNIAIAGNNLYVADRGNRRIQVFALGSLALRHVWGPHDAAGRLIDFGDRVRWRTAWKPVDVTSQGGRAYILDGRYGRIYRHQPGTDALHLVIDAPTAVNRWSRIAVDREGRIYLLDHRTPGLDIYDSQGCHMRQIGDASEVRERFDAPAIRLDHKERFCLPESLMRWCNRQVPTVLPTPESPLALCLPQPEGGVLFDRAGNLASVEADEPPGPKLYQTCGTWISQKLDSQIHRCQWHRVELELSELPPGTRVVISTYTDDQPLSSETIEQLEHRWDTHYTITGPMQPPPQRGPGRAASHGSAPFPSAQSTRYEFLVQSRAGRYLWLKVQMTSDGYATPAVQSILVQYPRQSYLQYLPAVYAADEESSWFLERFLSIFQTEWDSMEGRIDAIAGYFDPRTVPEGDFLVYLARWLALPLEGDWNWEQKRRLLMAAPRLYPRRGTADGLREYLRIYLQNITGLNPDEQQCYPQIVEGFQERQHLMLSVDDLANLGRGVPLWSLSMVGRLQLGVFAREGEVRLVSTGDPQRELFHEYAHRFRVFVPASWVQTAQAERLVRRALDAEKPAHTRYDLCLIEPRFRVGFQSTIGLDTIIGDYPMARLACPHEADVPPSRPPRHRLGYDTILARRPAAGPSLQLAPGAQLGLETILT